MQPLKLCDKHAIEELWAIITNMSNGFLVELFPFTTSYILCIKDGEQWIGETIEVEEKNRKNKTCYCPSKLKYGIQIMHLGSKIL